MSVSSIIEQHGQAMGEAYANVTGATATAMQRLLVVCACHDGPTVDDEGDELGAMTRPDRWEME